MIITKIELENITTHKKTTIDFHRGLNLLYGPNGTGKSTVLKMIGFVLFDFLPGSQKNYIRKSTTQSPKFGKIRLWVVGLNDDQFVIQRTLAKAKQSIEVSDAKTGIVLIMFPLWCWVNWYYMRFITASYTASLSLESAEYSRDVLRSDKFREIFPELDIKQDKDTKSNFRVIKKKYVSKGRVPQILIDYAPASYSARAKPTSRILLRAEMVSGWCWAARGT